MRREISTHLQKRKSPTSNPAPDGSLTPIILVYQPCTSPLWLATRLLASGDAEPNMGPKRRQQLAGLE